MSELEKNFDHLRLKLAIRKKLRSRRDCDAFRSELLHCFRWASLELFNAVVDECMREGTLTEETGERGATKLVWVESAIKAQG